MKNNPLLSITILVLFVFLTSCSSPTAKQENNTSEETSPNVEVEVFGTGSEDLKYFDKALEEFDKKNLSAASENLRKAAMALKADSTEDSNKTHLKKAVALIDSLATAVETGNLSSKLVLFQKFAAAELMISHHYFKITEEIDYEELSKYEIQILNNALANLKSSLIHGSYYDKEAGLDLIRETNKLINKLENGEDVDPVRVKNEIRKIKNFAASI